MRALHSIYGYRSHPTLQGLDGVVAEMDDFLRSYPDLSMPTGSNHAENLQLREISCFYTFDLLHDPSSAGATLSSDGQHCKHGCHSEVCVFKNSSCAKITIDIQGISSITIIDRQIAFLELSLLTITEMLFGHQDPV